MERLIVISIILLALLFVGANGASLDLSQAGCGNLLDGNLLDITCASFSASSGNPGVPLISGKPWIPTILDDEQYLIVDLGKKVKVSEFEFAGDPTKPDTTNQIRLFYRNDGKDFKCANLNSIGFCRPYFSGIPPKVPGSYLSKVDLGKTIDARYFKFQPLEPNPKYRDGASSLRIELKGCLHVAPKCGPMLDSNLLDISSASFTASSGNPGVPLISGKPWIPTVRDNEQYLIVDLGKKVKISKFEFAGDPTKPDTTNQIRLFYRNDGEEFTCAQPGSNYFCKPYFSGIPPKVPGSYLSEVDLGKTIYARYFKFQPLEPNPKYRDGASSLRIELKGCIL